MDSKVEQAYLYDFYGELLNEHQRKIYEDYAFADLSFSEIASEEGISRQGVHDMIKRCQKTLEEYERKLHLVRKFLYVKERVEKIQNLTDTVEAVHQGDTMKEIAKISGEILEEL